VHLKEILNSAVKIKIISFFEENPASIDTAKGIATWINQDVEEVKKALEELVRHGFLSIHRSTSTIGYAYIHDKKTSAQIREFLDKEGLLRQGE
jgi:predicted transcriptional regulator